MLHFRLSLVLFIYLFTYRRSRDPKWTPKYVVRINVLCSALQSATRYGFIMSFDSLISVDQSERRVGRGGRQNEDQVKLERKNEENLVWEKLVQRNHIFIFFCCFVLGSCIYLIRWKIIYLIISKFEVVSTFSSTIKTGINITFVVVAVLFVQLRVRVLVDTFCSFAFSLPIPQEEGEEEKENVRGQKMW